MHDSLTGQLLLILLVKRPIKVIQLICTTDGTSHLVVQAIGNMLIAIIKTQPYGSLSMKMRQSSFQETARLRNSYLSKLYNISVLVAFSDSDLGPNKI